MKSSDWYKILDLEYPSYMEEIIKNIIATLDNYEYLKTKIPKCECKKNRLIIEGICAFCGGNVDQPV